MKTCISCGMPLREAADYPLGDTSKEYCVHCANADGTLQTYEERLEGMTQFIIRTKGFAESAARAEAAAAMQNLPAWKNRI